MRKTRARSRIRRLKETDRKKRPHRTMGSKVREPEDIHRLLSRLTSDYAFILRAEPDGTFVPEWVSDAVTGITGYTPEEITERGGLIGIAHPEDRELAVSSRNQVLAGKSVSAELRVITKDGRIRWLRDHVHPVWNTQHSRISHICGSAQDITDRKLAEQRLQVSESNYRELAGSITDVFFEMDDHLRYVYWNKASEHLTGVKAEDALGKSLHDLFPESASVKHAEKVYQEVLKSRTPRSFDLTIEVRGTAQEFELNAYPSQRGVSVIAKDISGRKAAEQALRESEERFRTLAGASFEAIALHDNGVLLNANDRFFELFGYTPQETLGKYIPFVIAPEARESVTKGIAAGMLKSFESTGMKKDGTRFPILVRVGELVQNGRKVRMVAIMDVSDLRQAQKELEESRDLYRQLARNFPNGSVYLLDRNLRFLIADGQMIYEFGRSPSAYEGKSLAEVTPPEMYAFVEPIYRAALNGKPEYFELEHRNRVFNVTALPAEDAVGKIMGVLVVAYDVTERRRIDKKLRESEERYRNLVEMSPDLIALHGDHEILYINPSGVRLLGATCQEEVVGKPLLEFVHPDHRQAFRRQLQQVYSADNERAVVETSVIRQDGRAVELEVSSSPVIYGGKRARQVIARDITERKRMGAALRVSADRNALILNSLPMAFYTARADEDFATTWISEKVEQMTGYSPKEFSDDPMFWSKRLHPNAKAEILASYGLVLEKGLAGLEYQWQCADGQYRWFSDYTVLTRDATGKPDHIIGIWLDTTNRKAAEQALFESEQRFRVLTESVPHMIWSASGDGVPDFYNTRLTTYLGTSLGEIPGDAWADFVHPDDRRRSIDIWTNAVKAGTQAETEYRIRRASDGQYRWHLVRATPLRDSEGRIVRWYGSCTDIHDLKKAEGDLRVSSRRLALLSKQLLEVQESERRNIARELHDQVGQLLTAVKLSLQSAHAATEINQLKTRCRDNIDAVERTINAVRNLSLDLHPSILDDLGLIPALRWYADKTAKGMVITTKIVSTQVDERLPANIEVALFRIFQEAFTNVLRHSEATCVDVSLEGKGNGLQMTIRDNGKGFISREAVEAALHGKSLGLIHMQERAALVGGSVEFSSIPGSGTKITVALPVMKKRGGSK